MAHDGNSGGATARMALFDNAKLALMALVVTGHLLQMGFRVPFRQARALLVFIYAFHMPLFVFLSGLFVRRRALSSEAVARRSARLLALGMGAKLLDAAARLAVGRPAALSLLGYGDISWFMLVMAAYLWLALLLREAPAVPVGVVGLALALVVGYLPWVGDVLALSRLVVFFPWFWLGCALEPRRVAGTLAQRRVRVGCAVVVCAFGMLCLARTRRFYKYMALFKGRCWYGAVTKIRGCSWTHRLRAYAMSGVVGAGVLGIVPRRELPGLTRLGARTRQVYLLHYPLLYLLRHGLGLVGAMVALPWGWALPLPVGVALTLLLSAPGLGEALGWLRSRVALGRRS